MKTEKERKFKSNNGGIPKKMSESRIKTVVFLRKCGPKKSLPKEIVKSQATRDKKSYNWLHKKLQKLHSFLVFY